MSRSPRKHVVRRLHGARQVTLVGRRLAANPGVGAVHPHMRENFDERAPDRRRGDVARREVGAASRCSAATAAASCAEKLRSRISRRLASSSTANSAGRPLTQPTAVPMAPRRQDRAARARLIHEIIAARAVAVPVGRERLAGTQNFLDDEIRVAGRTGGRTRLGQRIEPRSKLPAIAAGSARPSTWSTRTPSIKPSANSRNSVAWVASNTSSSSTRRPASSLMSKKRRQLISSLAVCHHASRKFCRSSSACSRPRPSAIRHRKPEAPAARSPPGLRARSGRRDGNSAPRNDPPPR